MSVCNHPGREEVLILKLSTPRRSWISDPSDYGVHYKHNSGINVHTLEDSSDTSVMTSSLESQGVNLSAGGGDSTPHLGLLALLDYLVVPGPPRSRHYL